MKGFTTLVMWFNLVVAIFCFVVGLVDLAVGLYLGGIVLLSLAAINGLFFFLNRELRDL